MTDRLSPWQNPITADFYEARGEDNALEVKLDASGTKIVWEAYETAKHTGRWSLLAFGFDGKYDTTFTRPDDLLGMVEYALDRRLCIYNVKRRKCWRPVWHGTPIDRRSMNNFSYESVVLYGFKSFMESWEHRPKARLFAND
jgi:hypothetical protein